MTNVNEIEAALRHLDSQDRDQWVRIGAAIKTELGDDGFNVWDSWSQGSDNYKRNSVKSVWKSLKAGKVNIGTLFYEARKNGYSPTAPFKAPTQEQLEARRAAQEASRLKAEHERRIEVEKAVETASVRWGNATPLKDLNHPYLVNKGINDWSLTRQLRIDGDNLLLPLKRDGKIVGLQEINPSGAKLFTKGMELKGASTVIGSWSMVKDKGVVLAEGYATAASIHKATGMTTIVCMTGHNLAALAERLPKNMEAPIIIAADSDLHKAGLKYAQAAQEILGDRAKVIEPNFTQEDIDNFQQQYNSRPSDFNDLHKLHGLEAVNQQLTQTLVKEESKPMSRNQEQEQEQAKVVTNPEIESQANIDVQSPINRARPTDMEVRENSISPDYEMLIAAQQKTTRLANNETKESKAAPEQNAESTSLSESKVEAKQKTIDLRKEFNRPIVTDLDYDHPPGELKAKYLCTKKGDYLDRDGVVHFKDKGMKLTSPKTDIDTIQDMLSVAQAKGWSSITVRGKKEFRRAAFLEANARGIAVNGYWPNAKDLAVLDQMREERAKNQIEQNPLNKSQEKSLDTTNSQSKQQTQTKGTEKIEVQQPSEAQIQSEKETLLAQNTAPTHGHIESSAKVDLDSNIPMQNIGGQEIQSELRAFAATLTPKQQGLDKNSLAKLQEFKSVARMMISGLNKDDRSLAIRNFNENMDKSIHGKTLNIPSHISNSQERKSGAVKEHDQQREYVLNR